MWVVLAKLGGTGMVSKKQLNKQTNGIMLFLKFCNLLIFVNFDMFTIHCFFLNCYEKIDA